MEKQKKVSPSQTLNNLGTDQQPSKVSGQQSEQEIIEQKVQEKFNEIQQKNQQALQNMLGVVERIREFPLSKPNPEKMSALTQVSFPITGGVLSTMSDFEKPYRGFPYQDTVLYLDKIKKIAKTTFQILLQEFDSKNKIKLFIFFPEFEKIFSALLYSFWSLLYMERSKPSYYCQPVRELYKVLNNKAESEKLTKNRQWWIVFRDLICIFLEYDNAYKYRVQDIVCEIDKKALKENPIKEIVRLLELLIDREMPKEEMTEPKTHWIKAKKYIPLYLKFKPSIRKRIVEVLLELNFEEMRLNEEDQCFCDPRTDYRFGYQIKKEKCLDKD